MTQKKLFPGIFWLVLVLLFESVFAEDRKLTVNMVTGDVTYKRGKADEKPVRKATRLKSKDVIRTLVESSLEIKLDDGSLLTIEENSVVDLSKLVVNGQVTNSKINIKTGKVLFNIKKLASKRSDFVFETPTATAAIRGTQGGLGTDGKESFFYLEEGKLEITPKGGGKGAMIGGLNVAMQTPAGMKVETMPDMNALKQAITQIEQKVLDTASAPESPAPVDTSKAPVTDTTKVDTTSQAPVDTGEVADTAAAVDETIADTTAGADPMPGDTVAAGGEGPADPASDSLVAQGTPLPEEPEVSGEGSKTDTVAGAEEQPDTSSAAEQPDESAAAPDLLDLTLVINTPVSGAEIPVGSQITVSGLTLPGANILVRNSAGVADASGNFSLTLNAPKAPGNYILPVTAEHEGRSVAQEVSFVVPEEFKPLVLSLTAPTAGQEFPEGSTINLSGSVTEGAMVSVNGKPAAVSGNAWNAEIAQAPLGELTLRVEAVRGEENVSQEVSVVVKGKPVELKFAITRPAEGTETRSANIEVGGTGTPGAKVSVNGMVTAIPAAGTWALTLNTPAKAGPFTLAGEAVLGDQTLTAEVGLVKLERPLKLSVAAPAPGTEISTASIRVTGTATPGAEVNVQGQTALADASGNWSINILSPPEEGDYTLEVQALLGSQELAQDIEITRVIPKVPLIGSVNKIPSEVNEPKVTLTGTCNDGAVIEVGNFNTTVRGGQWTLNASWPAEDEGTQTFEVYCVFNGEDKVIGEVATEYIRPRIPLSFNLITPTSVTQTSDKLDVRGAVKGQDVTVEVNGKGVPIISGQFVHTLNFNESNWEDLTDVEIVVSDGEEEISRAIEINVDKTSPLINRNKPRHLSEPLLDAGFLKVRMADNAGDEVNLSYQVDGAEEEDFSFEGSLSQAIPLVAGVHDYRLEATDLAGNKTVWERRGVAHYPRVNLDIEVLNPRQNRVIPLPPYNPDRDFEPSDDVSIRIRQLPDDDFRYLKEVRIENRANGATRIWKDFEIDDIEFEFDDLPLVTHQTNEIVIRVIPKQGQEKIITRTYVMK